jgi:2-octaprenyl-6-methoxyphenol hydroxylase
VDADVAVVGAGFVGSALAIALGEAGLEVAVIDRTEPGALAAGRGDGRATAVALASKRMLDALGAWRRVARHAEPILDIRIADGDSSLFLHYDHRDVGSEPLGFMAENRRLRPALLERLGELGRVRLLAPAAPVGLERDGFRAAVLLADGRRVVAPLAVAADGRESWAREAAGIRVTRFGYRQVSIVCTVGHERPHVGVAHEHFYPAGPFAILPLKGRHSSVVWTERADLAPALLALDEAEFADELARRFGDFLGRLRVEGRRYAYPLSLQYAEAAADRRLALVGDALHAIHPVAGQGVNLGFRDAAALAECVVEAKRLGLDLGDAPTLDRYRRWRRVDNGLMVLATDGIIRLFSTDFAPVRVARDLGLALVNRLPPLKRLLMREAMGLVGEVPRLLEGRPL